MKYTLMAQVTISIYTEVEANSLEEAIMIAGDRGIETTQYQAEEQAQEFWCADEYDGTPQNIRHEKD